MNTWTHPTNSRIALALPVGTFSSNKHTKQQSVNILIRDTYIWVGFHSQCLYFLAYSLFQAQKTTNTHHDDDLIPRQLDWAQLRRDWLEKKNERHFGFSLCWNATLICTNLLLNSFSWMFFRKGVVRGCIIDDNADCVSFSHSCVNKGQVFLSLLCAMPQESLFSRCWSDYVSTSVWLFRNAAALH